MLPFNLVTDLPFPLLHAHRDVPECFTGVHKHNKAADMNVFLCLCISTWSRRAHILQKQKVIERRPATNGVRPSHLALTLPLGQCHNNCP